MYGREAKETFGESLGAQTNEKLVMGQSIRWYTESNGYKTDFPDFDTGMFKTEDDCLHVLNGDWEQETGFRRNMAEETEYIRDYGLYTIFGNWWYQKNKSERKDEYANYSLKWASHLGGKRESYRVVGDHILTQNDIENHVIYDDCTACMTWSIDIHFPEATNEEKFGEARVKLEFVLGLPEEKAAFDLEAMAWLEEAVVVKETRTVDEEEKVFQVLTGYKRIKAANIEESAVPDFIEKHRG